jgi:hypothetical protein
MARRNWVALVAATLLGTGAASAQTAATADIQKALDAVRQGDCATAMRIARPALNPDRLAKLAEADAAGVYLVAATCLPRDGDMAGGRRAAMAGTALASASDVLWMTRLALDMQAADYPAASATVTAMAPRHITALNGFPLPWLYELGRKLKAPGLEAPRAAFLRVVGGDSYRSIYPWASKDLFREDLARILLDEGDREAAAALVRQIAEPYALLELSLDTRLGAIVSPDVDLRAAAEAELGRARDEMARFPFALAPILGAARDLRMLGRPDEALALLNSATANGKLSAYLDAKDQANWWWNSVAEANQMLGNTDAAFAAYREGAAKGERGYENVSQVINLAHAQVRAERYADALATIGALKGNTSPFGAMEAAQARGCANAGLKNMAALAADRAFVAEHEKDNRDVAVDLSICAGDLDAAAAAMIRMLDDPDARVRALILLSDYDPPLPHHRQGPYPAGYAALKQRADVKAAIARAGGTRRVPLQRGQI